MKVNYNDRQVDATEVEVLMTDEKWNTYQLADGKVLIFKEVLTSIVRLDDEKDKDGNPIYAFQTQRVVRIK